MGVGYALEGGVVIHESLSCEGTTGVSLLSKDKEDGCAPRTCESERGDARFDVEPKYGEMKRPDLGCAGNGVTMGATEASEEKGPD
jgi:hypothetical protein